MKNFFATKIVSAYAMNNWATAGFASILCVFSASIRAHVVLEQQVANAGSYYKATFKVGHGCGTSPVKQMVVSNPVGVRGAKPIPKSGWALDITQDATPGGTPNVSRVTWTAKSPADYLPSAWYDKFKLQAKLPAKEGTLYWPVNQICEDGRVDWVQIPQAGQKLSDLKSPAALLELLPLNGSGEHKH